MRSALYLVAFAGLLLAGIRFLVRFSSDPDSDNSVHRGFKGYQPLDSTAGSYGRQGTEMARDLDAEIAPSAHLPLDRAQADARQPTREDRNDG